MYFLTSFPQMTCFHCSEDGKIWHVFPWGNILSKYWRASLLSDGIYCLKIWPYGATRTFLGEILLWEVFLDFCSQRVLLAFKKAKYFLRSAFAKEMINTSLDKTFSCVLTSLFADCFSLWGQQRTAVNWERYLCRQRLLFTSIWTFVPGYFISIG